jgi:hypothetical protein
MLMILAQPHTAQTSNQQSRNQQTRAARRAAPTSQAPGQVSLPIRRVILYSNGVAYIERRGMAPSHAEALLTFKQSQIDDALKSLLVLDMGKGRIGAVSYNSSAPASARFNDIPFSIDASTTENDSEGGIAGVLKQLQGARVAVTTATRTAQGAILTIEERKSQIDANKPPAIARSLVIASESGEIASFDLADVRSVRLLDDGPRHDIAEFASVSASTRRRDEKTISITSDGAGPRELAVSYTIAAPIWKTTYRVALDAEGKPFFQGWAIVDNVGEEDWAGVQLSLVSGAPVSFIQPIQQPLYRYRPIIPIPDDLKLEPQIYEAGVGEITGYGRAGGIGSGSGAGIGPQSTMSMAGGFPADQPNEVPAGPVTSLSDAIKSDDSGVKAAARGNEIGDLFEYRIEQPVILRRNASALIPIIQTDMEGERVSIYNEATRKDRPMGGLRLKNTSALTLEGGSLTVIDGDAYAGEALIERLKPGEERFISFALDLGTLVAARSQLNREPAFLIKVVKGAFQAHYYQTDKKVYTITNQTDRPRVVFIEHPIRERWKLSNDTAKPYEMSASVYRFRVKLKPRATIELPVTEQLALMDSYALSNLTRDEIQLFVSRRYIDEAARAALEKIIGIKNKIAAVDARAAALDSEASEIATDQARLRENIKALSKETEARQLIARYVAKASEQETRVEQIASEKKAAAAERLRLQAELDAAIEAVDPKDFQ